MKCKEIIDSDVCINCGACAIISDNVAFDFENKTGFFSPRLISAPTESEWRKLDQVCPQSSSSKNEDEIASTKFWG